MDRNTHIINDGGTEQGKRVSITENDVAGITDNLIDWYDDGWKTVDESDFTLEEASNYFNFYYPLASTVDVPKKETDPSVVNRETLDAAGATPEESRGIACLIHGWYTYYATPEEAIADWRKDHSETAITIKKNTLHRDGTVTFWSVYEQRWIEHADGIEDRELAAMSTEERERTVHHLKEHREELVNRQLRDETEIWLEENRSN